ncbi:LytR/AlgR family response regulator transcription factor [Reichenbachiella ulvae]|uniref:LytTR family DNA-binding domain-containing protein n=1 Tax=Reichenbachiella ulvae TaxID=2980104 RepID=A0ABT3CYF6_9BACT|nr:LytTR family DNA-binding domain-containing protein [Reichenbachiella ulvae]MCV9388243.1 LytTR family DNA-binding domain-containing protein [Reichenbachiella ulvae]
MKVLIVEDEAPAFRRLQKMLEEVDETIEIVEVIDGVEESVNWMKGISNWPDLIFMDIQLSDGISFDIFEKVKVQSPVIFTTAFDEYMLKAFRVNSIDYLLKPINQKELVRSLDKYQNLRSSLAPVSEPNIQELMKCIQIGSAKYKSRFLVKMGEKMMSVETENIAAFQALNGLVYLISQSGKRYVIDLTLEDIMKELDPEKFYRVNRQFILCYHCIDSIHKYGKSKLLIEPKLELEEPIIVSSERASAFKQWLG